MKTSIISTCSLALVLGVFLSRIEGQPHLKSQSGSLTARDYVLSAAYSSWPGWGASRKALESMSKATPGLSTVLSGPADGDVGRHIEELEALILRRVNGIVLCGSDSKALSKVVNKASSNGVPVVTMFTDADDSTRLTFLGGDDRQSARRLVESVVHKMKRPSSPDEQFNVLVSYIKPGMTWGEDRLQGVKDALAEFSWLKLVDVVSDHGDDAKGAEAVSAAWRRFGKLDLIIGLGGRSAMGAVSALKEMQISKGSVTVIGWDRDSDALQAIKDQWISAVSAPRIEFMTQLAISILEAQQRGYLQANTSTLNAAPTRVLPSRIEIEQRIINQDNIESFL